MNQFNKTCLNDLLSNQKFNSMTKSVYSSSYLIGWDDYQKNKDLKE